MSYRLDNKRAPVTGGSTGIGAAIVKRLAREGAHVALTHVGSTDRANETVKAVQALAIHAGIGVDYSCTMVHRAPQSAQEPQVTTKKVTDRGEYGA
jgi:NAD(P)-dependent dehydrogenase (short-subunit alcohol dehydrogenase family)